MKKRTKINLLLSAVFGLIISFIFDRTKTISGHVVSTTYLGLMDLKSLAISASFSFVLCFLFFQICGFGKDALQKRLEQMEQQYSPSGEKHRGLLKRISDLYHFSTRKVYHSPQNENKYVRGSNFEGFPELYSQDAEKTLRSLDPRIKEIIVNSAKEKYENLDSTEKRKELIYQNLQEIDHLIRSLPEEDLKIVLNSSKGKSLQEVEYSIGKILGREAYSVGKITSPRQLIAVHKTNYLPQNGRIRTTGNETYTRHDMQSEKLSDAFNVRQTVSFSLNHPVVSHLAGKWSDTKYAILLPVENIIEKELVNLSATDSYAFGDVPLKRKGAEIIISKKAYKTMSPREIERLKKRTGAEIVTFQNNEDGDLDDTIKRRIRERGYDILYPGFYDEFNKSMDRHFKQEIGEIANQYGKNSTMHAWTPSAAIEERVSTINRLGRNTTAYDGSQINHSEYLKQNLDAYKSEIERARKGTMTRKDVATFKKLKKTAKNANKKN